MLSKMARNKKVSGVLAFVLLGFGCVPADKVYSNMYDGLRKREQMVNPAEAPTLQEEISFDAYKRERDERLKTENP